MNALYESLDISKQAVHQYARRQRVFDTQVSQLVLEADELRGAHPGCGVEKRTPRGCMIRYSLRSWVVIVSLP